MKTIGLFSVVVIASIAFLQPAEGRGSHGGGHSFSSPHHFSSAGHYSGVHRNYSGNTARYYRSAPYYSSQAALPNRTYRTNSAAGARYTVNRTAALNPRVNSAANQRLSASRRNTLAAQGITSQGRVVAPQSRSWNRNQDHFWHGHRCHWHNNSWVIIDPWFWGYGYGWGYPYGYSYYDDGYGPADYQQSEYDQASGNPVSQVQEALARQGYYHGAIDGSVGPMTRNAIRRYQRDRGLEATGQIDQGVIQSLGLR